MVKSILNGTNLLEIIKDETLATIFRETARKYQNKTALIYKDKNLSYKQLDEWSDAIAVFLFKKGIGNGKPVGVCLPRGLELHVTILGIIKSGASYVPMDYEIPQERIEIILEEVNAVACFTDKTLKSDILLNNFIQLYLLISLLSDVNSDKPIKLS